MNDTHMKKRFRVASKNSQTIQDRHKHIPSVCIGPALQDFFGYIQKQWEQYEYIGLRPLKPDKRKGGKRDKESSEQAHVLRTLQSSEIKKAKQEQEEQLGKVNQIKTDVSGKYIIKNIERIEDRRLHIRKIRSSLAVLVIP